MKRKQKADKTDRDRIVNIIRTTEKKCQNTDCQKCNYAQFGEDCYPMMLSRSLRCGGMVFKTELETGGVNGEV